MHGTINIKKQQVVYKCVFVALVIQQAKRMRCIILSSVASPSLQNLFTLSQKGRIFLKKSH